MTDQKSAVLRAAVRAEVLSAGLGVTSGQADDIARRVIAADHPELTNIGGIRLASGEALGDALARHRMSAPHLFDAPETPAQADAATAAKRAKLAALPAAARLEAANGGGVTHAWVQSFRKGGSQ